VAARRGAMLAWHGVACARGGPRMLVLSRFFTLCFFPYTLSFSLFSISPFSLSLSLSLSLSRHPSLPTAFLSRFSASTALDRPAGLLLRG